MEIRVEKKVKTIPLVNEVPLGEVFSLAEWPSTKFLMGKNRIIRLDTYETIRYEDFSEWFHNSVYERMDYDEKDYFDDTFDEREVIIYESNLILTVDK